MKFEQYNGMTIILPPCLSIQFGQLRYMLIDKYIFSKTATLVVAIALQLQSLFSGTKQLVPKL